MSEYLVFNIIIFAGPFFLGLVRKYYFVDKWVAAFSSIFIVGIPFIIWDILVTDSHWMFNPKYVMGIYVAGLPVEEWLFFLTVPFACLYTWEMILRVKSLKEIPIPRWINLIYFALIPAGFLLIIYGIHYTGIVLLFLAAGIAFDLFLGTRLIYQSRFYTFLFFVVLFILVFNGYLTWRPVVTYGEAYQIGIRIFTIPIEDFLYGVSMLHLNTIFYEKIKQQIYSRLNVGQLRTELR